MKPTVSTARTWQVWDWHWSHHQCSYRWSWVQSWRTVGSHMKGASLALKPIIRAHRVSRGLVAVDFVRWCQINACLEWTAPGEEYIAASFPDRAFGSTHIIIQFAARSGAHRTWERSATEAVKTPGSSVTTLNPAARASYSPAPTHSTPQPRTRSGAKSGERDATLGYFWAKPWMPTWAAHRFTESLTSLVTSFGTEQTFKGNRALLNLTLRASSPKTGEQIRPLTGLRPPQSKEALSNTSVHSLDTATPVVTPIKGIMANTA